MPYQGAHILNRKQIRYRWLLAGLGLWLAFERPLATHHFADADTGSANWPLVSELSLTFQPLTQRQALQTKISLPPPCIKPRFNALVVPNAQRPFRHREQTSINLGERRAAYFGTLHSHTAASDGEGEVADAYRYARLKARLDFFAVTDHPEYWLFRHQDAYEQQKVVAAAAARPGFVPLVGFEYSHLSLGHYVVLNTATVHQAFDGNLQTFYDWLKRPEQKDALVMFAHPGFHDYRFAYEFAHFRFDPALKQKFVGLEVVHWNEYLRYFRGFFGVLPYIDEAIAQGWWVGAAASQDIHFANWGTRDPTRIAMLLPELSRTEINAALRQRHFYATTNRDLQFSVNAERLDHSWAMMGDHVYGDQLQPNQVTIKVRFYDHHCEERPMRLEAVLAGNVIATYDFPAPLLGGSPAPHAGEFTLLLPLDRMHLPSSFPLYFRFYQGAERATFTASSALFFDLSAHSPASRRP